MLVAAGAWAGGESEQPAAAAATEVDTSAMEAPALAAMVAAGELPPLAERLPSEPLKEVNVALSPLDASVAWEAGRRWMGYRRAGGPRTRILPDFLIAAHALTSADVS